jgi:hypothetical protein
MGGGGLSGLDHIPTREVRKPPHDHACRMATFSQIASHDPPLGESTGAILRWSFSKSPSPSLLTGSPKSLVLDLHDFGSLLSG